MVLVLVGCTRERPAKPNLVLITIDTLRADRTSLYGYERPTTPFLETLASRSTVFDAASATSSWTAPSMASLFTSLPARSHGVTRGFVWDGKVLDQDLLRDDFETLAEVLRRNGYETFGISTNGHLLEETGFAQGFDSFVALPWESAARVHQSSLAFRDEMRGAERFFLWVHYFDPHAPYEAHAPWFERYEAEDREIEVEDDEKRAGIADALAVLEDLRDRYDSEINHVDASLQRLFEALDLEAGSLVVVTSDHGEAFFDHGALGHGTSLFREETRVPLLIHSPGQTEPRRIEAPVSLADVYPTILDVAGIEPPPGLAGRSLVPFLRGERVPDRVVVSELDRDEKTGAQTALRWKSFKLHSSNDPEKPPRLFDVEEDPEQRRDLSSAEPERVRELQRRLTEWQTAWPRSVAPRKVAPFVAEKDRGRLRALGYLE